MPEIEITLTILKTVSTFDGSVMDGILTWIQTNVREKLPDDTSLKEEYRVKP